jgi:hypothetical protein
LALVFSTLLVLAPTFLDFLSFKHASHGTNSFSLGSEPSGLVIRSDNFLVTAFQVAAWFAEKPITVLNAPAHFVDLLISYAVSRKPFWWPDSLGPGAWRCLTFPLFALPAWFYVGFGVDALLGFKPVRTSNAVLSIFLTLMFGTIAAVLRFGLSDDPGLRPGLMGGFTLWTFLFAIPLAAWLRQKSARQEMAMPPKQPSPSTDPTSTGN